MDFQHALNSILSQFGKEKLFEKNIVSILADFKAFDECPSYRIFLKLLLGDGSLYNIVNSHGNDQNRYITTFLAKTGLDKNQFVSFLNLVSICYNGKTLAKHENISHNSQKYKAPSTLIPPRTTTSPKINISENISFLGIPLGSSYFAFESAIFNKRGYQKHRSKAEVSFCLPNFLFDKIGHITLHKFPDSKSVYKISTTFEVGNEIDALSFYGRILSLYRNKYGEGQKLNTNDVEWNIKQCSIHIFINQSWNIIIDYKISSSDIEQLEKYHRVDAERKRMELEQLRKKRDEEAKKLEEDKRKQLENRYLNDI